MNNNAVFCVNCLLSKSGEKKFGCGKCKNRKIKIDRLIQNHRDPSDRIQMYQSITCLRSPSSECKFNAYASAEYLACDVEFGDRFQKRNMWLEKFYNELQSAPDIDRIKVVEDNFLEIVSEIDFFCGAEDGVAAFFFAINWDQTTKSGEPFLEVAKQLILSKALEYEMLKKF